MNMCDVAKKYRKTFGDFRLSAVSATHCLLSAALVLIQVASNEPETCEKKAAAANVDLCLQCLHELSVSWRIAGKTHRNLALLKERKLRVPGKHERRKFLRVAYGRGIRHRPRQQSQLI